MEVSMRKALATVTIGLFLASGLVTTPAHAGNNKIVNGVSCSKLNATTKGKGNATYKCAKNPYYKKTKTTWTWVECLGAYKSLKEFKAEHKALVASGASADDILSSQDFIDGWVDATKDACQRGA